MAYVIKGGLGEIKPCDIKNESQSQSLGQLFLIETEH